MSFAVVLAVLAALCGRLGARSLGDAARVRVLALLYGVAVFEALAVAGAAPRDLALVLVAFAAGLSWRVPGRVQGWTADVGEVFAVGSALLLLTNALPERARTGALVAYAVWAIAGALAGRRDVQGGQRTALAIVAIGPAVAAVLLAVVPSAESIGVLVASAAVAVAVAYFEPPTLGELAARLGAAVLGSAAAMLVLAAVPIATPALFPAAVLGALLVDAARRPRRRNASDGPRSLARPAELTPAVRRTLMVIERLTDPLAAQTQVVAALDEMFPGGRFTLLRTSDAPQGLLPAAHAIGDALMTEVCRAGVLMLDDVDALPAASAKEAARLGGTLLIPVACGDVVYGALLVHHDAPDSTLVLHARRFADLLGHKLETHRLYRELEQRQRLATLGTFSAALIHDLRSPLSTVKLNLQMIDRADRVGTSDRESVDEAMRALERVFVGLGETLDFTRPLLLEVGRVDPAELAELVVLECRLLAREHEVTLRLTTDGAMPSVPGDVVRLRRVLDNLVRNALEVAPRGSEVAVDLRTEGAGVELSVCDRGPGIDPKVQGEIFEPFVSTKERGVGLGLAIASRVIELHNGRITAAARDGGGTCMRVWSPA